MRAVVGVIGVDVVVKRRRASVMRKLFGLNIIDGCLILILMFDVLYAVLCDAGWEKVVVERNKYKLDLVGRLNSHMRFPSVVCMTESGKVHTSAKRDPNASSIVVAAVAGKRCVKHDQSCASITLLNQEIVKHQSI